MDSKVLEVLVKMDGLSPWSESDDLDHCWYSFNDQSGAPRGVEVYAVGPCSGELTVLKGMQKARTQSGKFIVVCRKHANHLMLGGKWEEYF